MNIKPKPWTVEEYLETLKGEPSYLVVFEFFYYIKLTFGELIAMGSPGLTPPTILIEDVDEINPRGIEGVIYITRGLVEFCLAVPSEVYFCIEDPLKGIIEPPIGRYHAFFWMMTHEHFHAARRHNAVDEEDREQSTRSDEKAEGVSKAFEYDADMMATVTLYRQVKGGYGKVISDFGVRQIVVCAVFCALRTLPMGDLHSSSHPSRASRFYSVILKLAILNIEPNAKIDQDLSLPESKNMASNLMECLLRCEDFFISSDGNRLTKFGSLREDFIAFGKDVSQRSHVAEWDRLAGRVNSFYGKDLSRPS